MPKQAIVVSNVNKSFKLPHERHTSLKNLFINMLRRRRTYERQRVLRDVSFEIKEGEFFGVIGRNGNGKSTLLKLLAGIYAPDKGTIHVNGRLTPFIELGVGFNPELTGRENVYLNGALLGFSKREMESMYADIVEFAELEKFMDQKLKNYSSGMQVRLAFSIAIRAKSDILLIDEVLAVGDVNFQRKCLEVFDRLKQEGRTIIFVSHAMDSVRDYCDRVAVIENGELAFIGNTEKGIDLYNKLNLDKENERIAKENESKSSDTDRFGNGSAEIADYRFFDGRQKESMTLKAGEPYTIKLKVVFKGYVKNPAIGIMFRKNPQENLFGINNYYQKQNFGPKQAGESMEMTVKGNMPLGPGVYHVSFSVTDVRTASQYTELDHLNNIMKINVDGAPRWGILADEPDIRVRPL